jgi:hypothetical protein
MDDKIQQLVRSVLEAVDTRLSGVRAEMLAAANDVQHRHQQLLDTVVALQQRVDTLNQQRSTQERTIVELRNEIASLRQVPTPTMAVAPPVAAPFVHSPTSAEPSTAQPFTAQPFTAQPFTGESPHEAPLDLSSFTRPLMPDVHVTAQLPIVPQIEPVSVDEHRQASHHDVMVEHDDREAVEWAEANADSQADAEMIDLERLTRLLSDKLEHITLPHPE